MSSKGNKRVARKVHDISPSASESETEEKEVKSRNISAPKTGQNKKKSSSYSIDEKALLDVLKKKFGHDGKFELVYCVSNLDSPFSNFKFEQDFEDSLWGNCSRKRLKFVQMKFFRL